MGSERSKMGRVVCFALLAGGCGDDAAKLLVDVRTDWVPGVELARVRNTVEELPDEAVEVAATFGMDFIGGVRVAEIDLGERRGSHVLVTRLFAPDGDEIAMRRTRLDVGGTTAVTVVFSRTGVACRADDECVTSAPCAEGRCVEETCLQAPRAGACGETMYCSIEEGGCRPLPGAGVDAGSGDAGSGDAGPHDAGPTGIDAGPPDAGPPPCGADSECPAGEVCAASACATPTAYRFTRIWLRDPHMFAEVGPPLCVCADGTSYVEDSTNADIASLDRNLVLVLTPLDPSAATNPIRAYEDASCASAGSCRPGSSSRVDGVVTHTGSGDTACYRADGSTLGPYTAPNAPSPPCFVSDPVALTMDIGGALVDLTDVRVAATLSGSDRLVDGVLSGFLSTSAARADNLDSDPNLCDSTLRPYDVLKGGGACEGGDDRDGDGWYLYLDFEAERVDWSG